MTRLTISFMHSRMLSCLPFSFLYLSSFNNDMMDRDYSANDNNIPNYFDTIFFHNYNNIFVSYTV